MKETKRISKLFEDLYDGSPWIDVTLKDVLADINAAEASRKIYPNWNSTWEIVNHLIQWRLNVLQRVQGKVLKSPADNYFVPVENVSESAWKETLEKLETSQKSWSSFLQQFKEEDLELLYPGNEMTYYENIHGIIQHDAYHLGQIVILGKFMKQPGFTVNAKGQNQ